jgi:hypothetical protein
LLKDATHQSACFGGNIFQGGCRGISIETAHGNAEKRTTCEELFIGLAETGSLKFKLAPIVKCRVTLGFQPQSVFWDFGWPAAK